jgi:hypothetical protein
VAGGGVTAIITDWVVVPPEPLQLSVKVVALVSAGVVVIPLGGSVPDQPPDAVQDVAFCVDQVSVAVPPETTCDALEVSMTVGAGSVDAPTLMA